MNQMKIAKKSALYALLLLLVPVYYASCATVARGWTTDPIQYEMQSIMSAAPCTPLPYLNSEANVNVSNGWTRLDSTFSMLACPSKSLTAFHCTKPGGCGELSWTGSFKGAADGKLRHFVIDVAAGGEVVACVMPARSYGVGIVCKGETFKAVGKNQRFQVEGKAASAEVTELSLFVKATEGTHILQIGQGEPR
jgi:hypothetical protein